MLLWTQLRHSARSLARTPGATALLLLSIALGVGSNAAVAGFIRGLAVRDLPIAADGRTVAIYARGPQDGLAPLTYGDFEQIDAAGILEIAGAAQERRTRVTSGDRSMLWTVATITPGLARVLNLPAGDGVVISHQVWLTGFGGRSTAGEALGMAGAERPITGVAPEWLDGLYVGRAVDVWQVAEEGTGVAHPGGWWVLGRLKDGTSPIGAQGTLNAARDAGSSLVVLPYTGFRPDAASGVLRIRTLLVWAAAAVLLIGCMNVTTFLLARAAARSRESAVRVALGATRRQLLAQVLADSVLISTGGAAFGFLLATWTADVIPALLFVEDAEGLQFVQDRSAIAFALLACVLVSFGCGMLPFLEMRDDDPAAVLRRESAGTSKAARRFRSGLVIAQMAICCALLVGTALLFDGFRNAWQTSIGRTVGPAALVTVESAYGAGRADRTLEYFRTVERAAREVPGVLGSAWMTTPPGSRRISQGVRLEPKASTYTGITMDVLPFTPAALPLLSLPPLAGRMFGGGDVPGSCPVVVVNEAAAEAHFDGDAVGRVIVDPAGRSVEIVGVVAPGEKATAGMRHEPRALYFSEQGITPATLDDAPFQVPVRGAAAEGVLDVNIVSPDYFGVMALERAEGHLFDKAPPPEACRVAVVNTQAANLYFDGDAVGAALIDEFGRRTHIVGVVAERTLRTSQRDVAPAMYLPLGQDLSSRMSLLVRVQRDDADTLARLHDAIAPVDGGRQAPLATTLENHFTRTALASERIATMLVGISAGLALVLGGIGLYGAMNEAGRQRRREFAVRIALGARGWHIVRRVLADGSRLVVVGTLAGLLGSAVVQQLFARVAPGTAAPSAWIWIVVPLVMAAALVIASIVPARRALGASPLTLINES